MLRSSKKVRIRSFFYSAFFLASIVSFFGYSFQASAADTAIEDQMKEFEQNRLENEKEAKEAVESIQKGLNNLPTPTQMGATAAEAVQGLQATQAIPNSPQLSGFINHPAFQAFIKYVSDPAVRENMIQFSKSPHREKMLYFELGWAFLFFLIRFWVLLKLWPFTFLIRVFVRILLYLMFLGVSSIAIPGYFLGDPYLNFIKGLYTQVIKPFLPQVLKF